MKFLLPFRQAQTQRPTTFSLIDIGLDTVKALVTLVIPGNEEPQIVGYGLAETGGRDISGGRLEADAVTGVVNKALTEAEDSSEAFIGRKIVPDDVIFALSGRATYGRLFSVRQSRPQPKEPITAKELANLQARAERLVRQGLTDLPLEGGHWQPLSVTDAGLYLDGRLALGGLGLTGREVSFSVFGVAGQASALRALELLANRLDLMIANIVAAPQALTAVAPHREAIVLDIGQAGTDVCIIWDNALLAAGWIPFGGGFCTQAMAQELELSLAKARTLKHALATGELSQAESRWIKSHLEGPCRRWYGAVMEQLDQLSIRADAWSEALDVPLPRKIYLTGGGSLLPGLDRWLRSDSAPFDGAPEVSRLETGALLPVQDLTDGLDYNRFALALNLVAGLPVDE